MEQKEKRMFVTDSGKVFFADYLPNSGFVLVNENIVGKFLIKYCRITMAKTGKKFVQYDLFPINGKVKYVEE